MPWARSHSGPTVQPRRHLPHLCAHRAAMFGYGGLPDCHRAAMCGYGEAMPHHGQTVLLVFAASLWRRKIIGPTCRCGAVLPGQVAPPKSDLDLLLDLTAPAPSAAPAAASASSLMDDLLGLDGPMPVWSMCMEHVCGACA